MTENDPKRQDVLVHLDLDRCTGHAQCAVFGPDVYELDEHGYCISPDGPVPAELAEQAREGAMACPEQALTTVELG